MCEIYGQDSVGPDQGVVDSLREKFKGTAVRTSEVRRCRSYWGPGNAFCLATL